MKRPEQHRHAPQVGQRVQVRAGLRQEGQGTIKSVGRNPPFPRVFLPRLVASFFFAALGDSEHGGRVC